MIPALVTPNGQLEEILVVEQIDHRGSDDYGCYGGDAEWSAAGRLGTEGDGHEGDEDEVRVGLQADEGEVEEEGGDEDEEGLEEEREEEVVAGFGTKAGTDEAGYVGAHPVGKRRS